MSADVEAQDGVLRRLAWAVDERTTSSDGRFTRRFIRPEPSLFRASCHRFIVEWFCWRARRWRRRWTRPPIHRSLTREARVGSSAIVLGDANEEEPMKNVFSTSHTIATLFSDDEFVWSALGCEDDAEFRRKVRDYVTRRMQAAGV